MSPLPPFLTQTLSKRYYYYYTYSLSGGAIAGIVIASVFVFMLLVIGCAFASRYSFSSSTRPPGIRPYNYRNNYGNTYGTPATAATAAAAAGNNVYPQTEIGKQQQPRVPEGVVVNGQGQQGQQGQGQHTAYAGAAAGEWYAPNGGK